MRILKDTVRPELARIKRELEALKGLSVHIGIMGDSENDLLMIARVHEYGATINAKNVKHLAIPLTDEAKGAKSPRQFDDLRFIPVSPGYGFLVRDKKPHKKPDKARQPAQHKANTGYASILLRSYIWIFGIKGNQAAITLFFDISMSIESIQPNLSQINGWLLAH